MVFCAISCWTRSFCFTRLFTCFESFLVKQINFCCVVCVEIAPHDEECPRFQQELQETNGRERSFLQWQWDCQMTVWPSRRPCLVAQISLLLNSFVGGSALKKSASFKRIMKKMRHRALYLWAQSNVTDLILNAWRALVITAVCIRYLPRSRRRE